MTGRSTLSQLDLRTIVLVGGRDFGRCPLASRLPAALWPIGDRPALARLLDHLAREGVPRASVCCDASMAQDVASFCRGSRLATTVVPEELMGGTGGCLRDAASADPGELILVLSASMAVPPPLADLIEAHRSSGAEMTVVFNPGRADDGSLGPSAEIFVCRPQVLERIPAGGYSDIKEGVIPSVVRAGGVVRPYVLERPVGNFRERQGYLDAVEVFLSVGEPDGASSVVCGDSQGGPIRVGLGALVHPQARICGPVLIGEHAQVREDAVVIGPAILGPGVVVGEKSVVVRSALWTGVSVGRSCEIRESILGFRVKVLDGAGVIGRAVSSAFSGRDAEDGRPSPCGSAGGPGRFMRSLPGRWLGGSSEGSGLPRAGVTVILAAAAVVISLLWSYWPTMRDLIREWRTSQEYSSGMLVPFLAIYVVWSRRQEMGSATLRPALLWGAGALLLAQVCRGLGLYYMYRSGERLSLVLSVAALVLLMMGWGYLKKLWPVLVFLCLMLPWPNRIQAAVSLPLQRWATSSAVFCLELGGWDIVRSGNTIDIEGTKVAVAEACNGLRMITAFFVISALVVLLTRRSWWEKLIVLLSSVPIALLCNTVRLVVTALLYTVVESTVWRDRIHDGDGYAMMPLALAMVVGELWLLSRLTTPPMEIEPAIVSRRQPQHVPDP
ncbi:MAG: exosortase [Phycisphaerae bacterium]|nr:exosortase [Phycisphaerae bacterium]